MTCAHCGTCCNCKFWIPFNSNPPHITSPDKYHLGICTAIGQPGDNKEIDKNLELAQVEDMSGCAGMRTAANFGCILYQAKE